MFTCLHVDVLSCFHVDMHTCRPLNKFTSSHVHMFTCFSFDVNSGSSESDDTSHCNIGECATSTLQPL